MDFVTGLPPSEGKTVVLTVVDRFSKMAHFIALPKLPSARGTAEAVLFHVFRLHGLPQDVVLDRGPQFTPRFCRLLGATVSLSSGFHPQTNGQTERYNQEMETTLRCITSQNTSSWSGSSSGWSMPTTLSRWHRLACHLSSASMATNLRCFLTSRGRSPFHQRKPWSAVVTSPGREPGRLSCVPMLDTRGLPTVVVPQLLAIGWAKRSDSQPVTCQFEGSAVSWVPGLWAHSRSPGSSTRLLFVSTSLAL